MKTVSKRTQVDQRVLVSKMQRTLSIGRIGSLLKSQQKMTKATLARAIRAKYNSQGSQANFSRVLPNFEIFDLYLFMS